MESDFEIGRVVAVDTAEVTIELSRELKALTQSTYEGAREVGKINSYVMLPVGARRLVAIVTRVVLVEEAELKADRTMVTLPSARRLMKATLIGTIDGSTFTQGIATFPVLDNPAHVATKGDLQTIFDIRDEPGAAPADPKIPGFCIEVGRSAVIEDFPVQIDPDAFFGKHAAVLGSTGSGKSCTIAAIIQAILQRPEVLQTNIVVLDTNGEYREAFLNDPIEATYNADIEPKCLYIPSDPAESNDRLVIPYWFMNAEDFVRLFRAGPNVQRPVLLDALRLSRSPSLPQGKAIRLKELLLRDLYRIVALSDESGKTSTEVEDLATGCKDYLDREAPSAGLISGDALAALSKALSAIAVNARRFVGEPDGRRFSKPLPLSVQELVRASLQPVVDALVESGSGGKGPSVSADTPVFFRKTAFVRDSLASAMQREESGGGRTRDYCATMLMRIYRLLEDTRFEFLFGPIAGEWPESSHSLAAFIRDILGLQGGPEEMSSLEQVPKGALPFYDRQRSNGGSKKVVIIDLSLLASEVLENVTALIGRLILEFLQRLGEHSGKALRGSLPVVLVLEEAQNYIHEQRYNDDESISRVVFERIAREGRKYGLSLVVASQRPSELSKTVLSQCSSFVVHRLQNPEDLRYFKEIVPAIYGPLLGQVSSLAPQTALILGECVRAPVLARIREARPIPRSRDPKFYAYWVNPNPAAVPVEAVCRKWEGKDD